MALEIRPLHPLLGVEIVGVDVNHVDADIFERIVGAFEDHSVLLFRGQRPRQRGRRSAFSRRFGPLETTIRTVVSHAGLDTGRKSPTSRTSTRTTG